MGIDFDAGNITELALIIIGALIVIGLLISAFVTAIVVRIVVAVAVVVLAFVVWQQRSKIENRVDDKKCNFSFFGVTISPPDRFQGRICGD